MKVKLQGIYQIKNKIDNKVYIGQVCLKKGHNRRWHEHLVMLRKNKHYNKHLQSAWNKYGEENFEFEILEEVLDELYLDSIEQKWIDLTWEYNYNIQPTAGGSVLGQKRTLTEQAKLNISKANKARPWTKEDRDKQSESLSGIKRDEKFKKKRREIMLGSKASDETREKMSKALKGRVFSAETIEKMRQAALLRYKNKPD